MRSFLTFEGATAIAVPRSNDIYKVEINNIYRVGSVHSNQPIMTVSHFACIYTKNLEGIPIYAIYIRNTNLGNLHKEYRFKEFT